MDVNNNTYDISCFYELHNDYTIQTFIYKRTVYHEAIFLYSYQNWHFIHISL